MTEKPTQPAALNRRTLLMIGLSVAGVMVLNNWVTYNNSGPQTDPFNWTFEITNNLIVWLLWAVILPVVTRWFVKIGRWSAPWLIKLVSALVLSLLVACFHRYGSIIIYVFVFKIQYGGWLNAFGEHSLAWVIRGTIPSWIQLVVMQILMLAVTNFREKQQQALRLSELNAQLSDAELNALKMQLHPHFFFNTLNTISSLMDVDIDRAQQVVAKLGQLMRTMLDSAKRQFIPLQTEMDYIHDYLDIEGARFSDRLRPILDIGPETTQARIPNLLLQPLVENSIKHGIGTTSDQVEIRIASRLEQDKLVLSVADNGRGVSNIDYVLQHPGIGIKSVQTRLHHLYGDAATLVLESAYQQGFKVLITLPYQPFTPEETADGH